MTDLPEGAIRVVAVIPTNPDSADAIRAGIGELVAATRQEPGCISYEAFESAATPGVVITVEAWTAQADLDAHMSTPHVAKAFEVLGPALQGDVAIHPLTLLA